VRVPTWTVPLLVVALAALGVAGARLFALPSYEQTFGPAPRDADRREVTFVVDGLRCVDTARRVAAQLEGMPGVVQFTGYATRHEAHITYDGRVTDARILRRAIEGPAFEPASGQFLFHQFRVVEVDGRTASQEVPR
jgi:copper chaperone CopZ